MLALERELTHGQRESIATLPRGLTKVSLIVPVRVPLLAAPEEFSHQLFALSGVAGCEKPPTNRLNLYWNLKYIDVRSFILTGAPLS